jgi:hypothetical protein
VAAGRPCEVPPGWPAWHATRAYERAPRVWFGGWSPANEGGQDLTDGAPIIERVSGDSLQGVDSAQTNIQLVIAKLIDRAGEPFSDLTSTAKVKLDLAMLKLDLGVLVGE